MKWRKIWFAVLVLFMILSIWFKNTGIEDDMFWTMYGIGIALWFLGAVVINQKWIQEFYKEVDSKMPMIKSDTDQYIKEMERLLEGKKSPAIIAKLRNNIGAAYMEKADFDKARHILLTVPEKGITKFFAPIYYNNLAQALYCSGKEDAFLKLLVLKVKDFEMLKEMAKNDTSLEKEVACIDLYRMLAEGQKKEVKKIVAEHPEWQQDENWTQQLKVIRQRT